MQFLARHTKIATAGNWHETKKQKTAAATTFETTERELHKRGFSFDSARQKRQKKRRKINTHTRIHTFGMIPGGAKAQIKWISMRFYAIKPLNTCTIGTT